jgi:hypothetical protein
LIEQCLTFFAAILDHFKRDIDVRNGKDRGDEFSPRVRSGEHHYSLTVTGHKRRHCAALQTLA